ncbi:MAG: SOS response-associated peptidase [Balneolales bacterium]|nr:SOS response-associated peptidase [Balneolales bacterium]
MFSRYTFFSSVDDLVDLFGVDKNEIKGFAPVYNAGYGSKMPIIIAGHARETTLVLADWGGIPASDPVISLSNLDKKPEQRKLLQRRRCIIPANGYFEWKRISDSIAIPFYMRMLARPIIGFAGVYDTLESSDGTLEYSFSVIETHANELVEPLSATMPAILEEETMLTWIDPLHPDIESLRSGIRPAKTSHMASFRVQNDVNDSEINKPSLIEPLL